MRKVTTLRVRAHRVDGLPRLCAILVLVNDWHQMEGTCWKTWLFVWANVHPMWQRGLVSSLVSVGHQMVSVWSIWSIKSTVQWSLILANCFSAVWSFAGSGCLCFNPTKHCAAFGLNQSARHTLLDPMSLCWHHTAEWQLCFVVCSLVQAFVSSDQVNSSQFWFGRTVTCSNDFQFSLKTSVKWVWLSCVATSSWVSNEFCVKFKFFVNFLEDLIWQLQLCNHFKLTGDFEEPHTKNKWLWFAIHVPNCRPCIACAANIACHSNDQTRCPICIAFSLHEVCWSLN